MANQELTAFQQSKKLYKVWFDPPAEIPTRSGARLFLSLTQVFGAMQDPKNPGQFKVSTREYSYRLLKSSDIGSKEILAYHWHPYESDLRDPHLHIRLPSVSRIHFPTSRVCIEDIIWMMIQYYGAKPTMKRSEWQGILDRNKKAFEKMATWKIHHQ